MRVNVLETEYKISVKKYDEDETFARESFSGYCDVCTKEIVICDMSTYKGWEYESKETVEIAQKEILRHEIVHAFFKESGLFANANETYGSWARNEEMVDWIALQGVKLYDAWKAVDAV